MTWLVFGVSCLLVLAGAVSITFGAPIIQLERGWAEVIAGSVAVSGGGVVFALGVVLMRLEALRDTVADAAPTGVPFAVRDVPLDALAALAEADPLPETRAMPEPAPVAPVADAAPPRLDEEARELVNDQGLWKRIKRPDGRIETTLPNLQPAAADGMVGSLPREAASAPIPAAEAPRSESRAPVAASTPRADLATPEPEPGRAAEDDAGQLGWLERSLFKTRAARQGADETQEPAGRGTRVEPSLGSLIGEPGPDRARPPEAPPLPPEPVADLHRDAPPAVAADEGPTVIGRYQAGVASYAMYSDGTIEVETEGGQSHRFGSMDELKAFIANQDKAEA